MDNITYFLDFEIKVFSTLSVFIRMNSTYEGRQSLPDNLKAHIRAVAMIVSYYKLTSEIFFYSFRFVDSTNIAGKMIDTFILC